MKILTYGSYGGLLPRAVAAYARGHGCGLLADQSLVDYVMSFRDRPMTDDTDFTAHPDELRFHRTSHPCDGITSHEFVGLADAGTVIVKVCVNEYDEKKTKVTILTYDGAEVLRAIPEYAEDDLVPGLYRPAGPA